MIGRLFKPPETEAVRMNGDVDIKSIQTTLKVFISSVSMSSLNECYTTCVCCVFELSQQMVISTPQVLKGGGVVLSSLK